MICCVHVVFVSACLCLLKKKLEVYSVMKNVKTETEIVNE